MALTLAQYATAQQRVAELAATKVPELTDPAGFEAWAQTVGQVIALGGRTAGSLAVRSYLLAREQAGKRSTFTPTVAGLVPEEQVRSSLEWAATVPEAMEATPASRAAGIVNRYVLAPARETTIAAAHDDPVATKVARVPRAGACAFCLLMASRGEVYHDTSSAGRNANSRFVGDGEYKFHDHCHCGVEVVWQGETYEPPEHVREAGDLYAAVTGDVEGKAKLAEFRRALDARRG